MTQVLRNSRRHHHGMGQIGETYYVDATLGNDANNGLTPATAWQTEAAINGNAALLPGDTILFKRGETWLLAAALSVPGDGLTLDAYGAGADPILDGQDVLATAMSTNGKNNLTIRNLHVKSAQFPLQVGSSSNCHISNLEASDATADGILCTSGANNIRFSNINSHDHPGAAGLDTCFEIKDDCHDIILDGFTFDTARYGISVHNHVPAHDNGIMPYNITIRNGTIGGTTVVGINCSKANDDADTDRAILFQDIEIDSTNVGSGVQTLYSGASDLNGVTFRRVHAVGVTKYPVDLRASVQLEYCVLHGGWHANCRISGAPTFYNCTMYRVAAKAFATEAGCAGVTVRNCIIYTEDINIVTLAAVANIDMDYNLYYCAGADPVTGTVYNWNGTNYTWANWLLNSGQDANSPTPADPTFTNAAADDFTLQVGSPAIDQGVVIPGVTDGYLGAAPDCGYAEKA